MEEPSSASSRLNVQRSDAECISFAFRKHEVSTFLSTFVNVNQPEEKGADYPATLQV